MYQIAQLFDKTETNNWPKSVKTETKAKKSFIKPRRERETLVV